MRADISEQQEELLRDALKAARDTRSLTVDAGARHQTAAVFESMFGSHAAMMVADENTFQAAGRDVQDGFTRLGHQCEAPFIFGRNIYAEYSFVIELCERLERRDVIPVAVGSGTINDLTKLAAHRMGRPYIVMATAASMDGYTAFGASITHRGSKQTFDCPAPVAVLADLEVISGAPEGMNASGYADLMAKCAAGGDWILADAAGEEAIDTGAWDAVQKYLRAWLASPEGIAHNEPACLRDLVRGLMMTGFAMQAMKSSRPASGAEHQFSHLWDMQHHTFNGAAPSHGFKVGIGTLATLALYEEVLRCDAGRLAVERAVANWPSRGDLEQRIAAALGSGELAEKAREEAGAKHPDRERLREQLIRLRDGWGDLQARLRRHLIPFGEAHDMLRAAGCAYEPEQIGISRERLRAGYRLAYLIRRRFTVLDFAERWGLTEAALDHLFGPAGPWPLEGDGRQPGQTQATTESAADRH